MIEVSDKYLVSDRSIFRNTFITNQQNNLLVIHLLGTDSDCVTVTNDVRLQVHV